MSSISAEQQSRLDNSIETLKALSENHQNVAFANSFGAEDMVLTDIISQKFPNIGIFSLDTGRLPPETYQLMQETEEKYGKITQYFYPDTQAIESYTHDKGINAFYQSVELRKRCCEIRKVEPLKRALQGKDAWITGMRREQSITRNELAILEYDEVFGLQKANPLADWKEADVWAYIKCFNVPYNALHDQHYPTIGCAPCTRAIAKGEDIRAGRWWWENPESKECGVNISKIPGS